MIKNIDIYQRALEEANYIVNNSTTIRKTAKHFCVSKSVVHHDLRVLLPEVCVDLANKTNELLEYNKSVRHIRGGEATKRKTLKNN